MRRYRTTELRRLDEAGADEDERIRYRAVERRALLAHNVHAFCLSSGNLRAVSMAELYIRVPSRIVVACEEPGPFLQATSSAGSRRVDL